MLKVKETLEQELKELEPKIQKARENGDFGTYKNLILAYKEVLNLIVNVDKSFPIQDNRYRANLVVNKDMGKFIFIKKDERILMDYANGYTYDDNTLTIYLQAIDKDFFPVKKNQLKGYILIHQNAVKNVYSENFSIYNKFRVKSSRLIMDRFTDKITNFKLILKIKSID